MWGSPHPSPKTKTQSLSLGPRCKSQLAQGVQAKLQLALVRAGAVTPPELPAPSPPRDRLRGREAGTDFTVGVGIGEEAGPAAAGVPILDYMTEGSSSRSEAPRGALECMPLSLRGRRVRGSDGCTRRHVAKRRNANKETMERGGSESWQPHPRGKSGLGPLPDQGRPQGLLQSGAKSGQPSRGGIPLPGFHLCPPNRTHWRGRRN